MPTVTGERYGVSLSVYEVSSECVILSQIGVVPRSQSSSLNSNSRRRLF